MALPLSNNTGIGGSYYTSLPLSLPELNFTQNLGLKNTYVAATTSGNTKLLKILDLFTTYGGKVIDILGRNGIIKNKNVLSAESFDLAAYQAALASGQLSSDLSSLTATGGTAAKSETLFGLDFTNPFTWIGILIVIFAIVYAVKQLRPTETATKSKK